MATIRADSAAWACRRLVFATPSSKRARFWSRSMPASLTFAVSYAWTACSRLMSRRLICARTCRASPCFDEIEGSAVAELAAARRAAKAMTNAGACLRCERAATALAQLAERLRDLYEQGQTDPLAIILGAQSLDEALAGIDDLNRSARLDRRLIGETRAARAHQQAVALALERRSATLERLRRDAAAAASAIAATRAQHTAYLANLRAKERLNGVRISSPESAAAAAQAKAATLVVSAPSTPASSPVTPTGPGTLEVLATGYSLGGSTATGLSVGWGVVAGHPRVVPPRTRLSIPGYREGV